MAFAFRAYDLNTAQPLGGGLYDELEDEAGHNAAQIEFQRIYPSREIHVEEITVAEYEASGGTRIEGINA